MKKRNFKSIGFSLAIVIFLSGFTFFDQRQEADKSAKEAFFHLNFFADGRGMHLVPGLIEVFNRYFQSSSGLLLRDKLLRDHWGFNLQGHWPVGLFDEKYKNMHVGVLGCIACHSGRAAGHFIVGLGNKNIDVVRIGKDAALIEKIYKQIHSSEEIGKDDIVVRDSALEFASLLSNQKIGNTTQGMVPVSFIRYWFYKQAGQQLPPDMTRGAVKIPSLWGYGEKRKVGQFSDGYGDGNLPGWAIAVELTGGQTPETVKGYISKVEKAENLFSDFLPPKYPFAIKTDVASRGKNTFEKTCAGCHGTYEVDGTGLPIYKSPKWIPLKVVGTDDDRLAANTPLFDKLVESSPLHEVIQHTHLGRGYFAPRLVGIWSRFPYLHNGSVPNVATLLTPPSERPQYFSVRHAGDANRFDQETLGLNQLDEFSIDEVNSADEAEVWRRTTYDTHEVGHTNKGHPFGTKLSSLEKLEVIEYLKTL